MKQVIRLTEEDINNLFVEDEKTASEETEVELESEKETEEDKKEHDETEKNESKVDYDFAGVDFGYPRTLEEVNAALDKADTERRDPSKWITSVEFHNRLEQKYPWLR